MKPSLSVSLVGAAAFAAGALLYRLGQRRCALAGAAAGPVAVEPRATPAAVPPSEAPTAITSLLERLRAQGL